MSHLSLVDTFSVLLGGHAVDEAPQLFDYSLYQLLLVSVVLPELRKDVVLLAGVLHPANTQLNMRFIHKALTLFRLNVT